MTLAEVRNDRSTAASGQSEEATVLMVQPLGGKRGPARTLQEFATYLASHRDIVVAIPDGLVSTLLAEHPRIRIIRLPLLSTRRASWRKGAAVLLSEFGGVPQPLLIHANGVSGLNLAGPLALRNKAPALVHFHDYEISRRMRVHLQTWRRLGVRMQFFPVSEYGRGLLETTAVADLVADVLPNPIRTSLNRGKWQSHQPFRISFIGSDSPRKGLHILVRIAERLRGEDIEWHIFGTRSDSNDYVRRCAAELERVGLAQQVRWRGVVDDPSPAYDDCDALLMPSLKESLPRVALEAMAHGIPIVAARAPGLSQLISHGSNGLLFSVQRADEAAALLLRLMHEPGLGNTLARAGTQTAKGYDVSELGRILEEHYLHLQARWPFTRVGPDAIGQTTR